MRRMLDPTKVGGIPSTIAFDNDGNREVKKNLKVDGKLKLQSLVSDTNPDGDITKELGGRTRHGYTIYVSPSFQYIVFTTKDYGWKIGSSHFISASDFMTKDDYKELAVKGIVPASGFYYDNSQNIELVIFQVEGKTTRGLWTLHGTDLATKEYKSVEITGKSYTATELF